MNTDIKAASVNIYYESIECKMHLDLAEHQHREFEICYVKEGKYRYFIDNFSYDLAAGDIMFVPANILHSVTFSSFPCVVSIIKFTSDTIPLELLKFTRSLKYLHKNGNFSDEIYHIFQDFEQEYKKTDILTQIALKNRLEAILIELVRNEYKTRSFSENSLIDKAKSYILENYSSPIRLSDLSEFLSLSEGHLSRLFKKETSLCLSEYINLVRLRQAKSMLNKHPEKSVSDIAHACGFNDSNYFSYKFKKHYGVPPTHIRNGKADI